MSCHLFFASTPFNMLTASMIAFSLPKHERKHICLIDQTLPLSPFIDSFMTWKSTPFNSCNIVSLKSRGSSKHKQRQTELSKVNQLLSTIKPTDIYTANDRRVEFQYAMAHCKNTPNGHYIDDGTYTYLGRKTHWLKDKLIDNLIKKCIYGSWWKQPPTVGASDWISTAHIAFPDKVTPLLQDKHLQHLSLDLSKPEFKQLSQICLDRYPGLTNTLQQLDALLLLPHDSVMNQTNIQRLHNWTNSKKGKFLAIKHHPRTANLKLFEFDEVSELPAELPIEVMLSLFKPTCIICGDISTALLTAKCLRPDLEVEALASSAISAEWGNLLSGIGVSTK